MMKEHLKLVFLAQCFLGFMTESADVPVAVFTYLFSLKLIYLLLIRFDNTKGRRKTSWQKTISRHMIEINFPKLTYFQNPIPNDV